MKDEQKKRLGARCKGVEIWQAYQSGSLAEAEQIGLEEHLLVCEACMQTYLNLIEGSLEQEQQPKLNADFTNRLLDQLFHENEPQKIEAAELKKPSQKMDEANELSKSMKMNDAASRSQEWKESKNRKVTLLISYCAAASIAMFFWVGGYFDGLSTSFEKGMTHLKTAEQAQTEVQSQKNWLQTHLSPPAGFIQTGWTENLSPQKEFSLFGNRGNLKPKKE